MLCGTLCMLCENCFKTLCMLWRRARAEDQLHQGVPAGAAGARAAVGGQDLAGAVGAAPIVNATDANVHIRHMAQPETLSHTCAATTCMSAKQCSRCSVTRQPRALLFLARINSDTRLILGQVKRVAAIDPGRLRSKSGAYNQVRRSHSTHTHASCAVCGAASRPLRCMLADALSHASAAQKPGAAMAERKAIMAQKEARMQDFHFVPDAAGGAEGTKQAHMEA
jgi:hypothetical protein